MSTGCQKDRKTGGQTDRHTDRKTDRLFSLVIKTKVFQNVNRMSKHQSDRKEDIQSAGQTDRVTERQNDSMADSRAAKEPALVFAECVLPITTKITPFRIALNAVMSNSFLSENQLIDWSCHRSC